MLVTIFLLIIFELKSSFGYCFQAQAIMFLAGNGSSVASNAANLKAQVQAPSSKLAGGDGVPVNQPINAPPSALSSPLSVSSHTGAQSGSGSTSTDELMGAKKTSGVPNSPVSKVEPPKILNAAGSVSTTPMMPSGGMLLLKWFYDISVFSPYTTSLCLILLNYIKYYRVRTGKSCN